MKSKRRLIGLGVLIFVVIAAMVALFGFRVQKMSVSGNNHHTSDEIADDLMTNFLSKNTLYLAWKYKNGEAPQSIPYLDSVRVTMKSPVRIAVQVSEKPLVGYVEDKDYVYFDAEGVVMETTDELYEDLPLVTGASLGEVSLYQKLPTQSSSQLHTILSLLELLDYYDLHAEEISFSESGEITVFIRHIEVSLGQDEYLEEKVANLNAVLKNISKNTAGILHLENVTGKYEDITFTPTGEVQEETEQETESESESESKESEPEDSKSADRDTTLGGTNMEGAASGTGGEVADEDNSLDEGDAEEENAEQEENDEADEDSSVENLMVFNSYGQLVYNVHVENGVVVDSYGSEVPGCSVNEDGYVVDAYMNIIDPATGDLMN